MRFAIAWVLVLFFLGCEERPVTMVEGNTAMKPLEIALGKTLDAHCGMVVNTLEHAAQVVDEKGRTWFFHDIGGVALWLKSQHFQTLPKIWAYTHDSHQWIDARKAWYTIAENTPMHYGFGAYQYRKEGMIPFEEMRKRMERGENLTNPFIRKKLLGY